MRGEPQRGFLDNAPMGATSSRRPPWGAFLIPRPLAEVGYWPVFSAWSVCSVANRISPDTELGSSLRTRRSISALG